MNSTRFREERDAAAQAKGVTAKLALDKLTAAVQAVRAVEASMLTAFELVHDAKDCGHEAGVEIRVLMGPELSAAWRVWIEPGVPDVIR